MGIAHSQAHIPIYMYVCVGVNVHLIAFVALQLPALSSMTNGCRNYRLMLLTYVAFA